jgi:ABC-type transport system involved in Fe-S cluster assembly fused permease/ATPase subunit
LDYIETEMITSLATIILVILCIAVFIVYGAKLLFYALVVVTLIVGFGNAWLVAKASRIPKGKQASAAPKGGKRKR